MVHEGISYSACQKLEKCLFEVACSRLCKNDGCGDGYIPALLQGLLSMPARHTSAQPVFLSPTFKYWTNPYIATQLEWQALHTN
jgi:hypothetical protein